MQVNNTRKNIPFEHIKVGEVFSWEGEVCMRTNLCKVGGILCNAVNLADGILAVFEDSDLVEKLNAELTIH